jgi:hypothetical protein
MDLPNYFLADLPDASTLSARLITDACATLKENRRKFLLTRTTDSLLTTISTLACDWLDRDFPFRQMALARGPAETGFSRQTIAAGLDRFFKQITRANLEALIAQDLGSARRLDEITSDSTERKEDRASIARGHDLLAHITGGVLPNPPITSIVLGLLVRSAQFIKCASGTSFFPRLFAHSLYANQPKLGACLELAEWKGGNDSLETALFAEAGCVTATGGVEALEAIRRRLPAGARFLPYGHKISFSLVARESLASIRRPEVVPLIVEDLLAWNQLGCLSPHVIYVETCGAVNVANFAELIAVELANRERDEPRGEIAAAEAAAIATRRMFYQVRAAAGDGTKVWASEGSTAWTVIFEADPVFQTSCLNRFIYVKPVSDFDQLCSAISPLEGQVSTVGVSAPTERVLEIASCLARWGVARVCPVGQMQNPPLTWRHDGRPALGDLVVFTDVEFR